MEMVQKVEEKNRALDLSFGPYSKGSGSTGSKIRGFSLHPKAFLLYPMKKEKKQ